MKFGSQKRVKCYFVLKCFALSRVVGIVCETSNLLLMWNFHPLWISLSEIYDLLWEAPPYIKSSLPACDSSRDFVRERSHILWEERKAYVARSVCINSFQ